MKLSKWRLLLFGFACFEFGVLDTWYVIGKGWYESLALLLFTPFFLLAAYAACQGLEENS